MAPGRQPNKEPLPTSTDWPEILNRRIGQLSSALTDINRLDDQAPEDKRNISERTLVSLLVEIANSTSVVNAFGKLAGDVSGKLVRGEELSPGEQEFLRQVKSIKPGQSEAIEL